jgi:DhnA family fructose-bisphosphate aldolase class Ia
VNYIPADIPEHKHNLFVDNLKAITRNKNRLFLFAADQKIEHLNEDFHGEHIHPDAADPEHLFRIAQQGDIGAFATQFGLIERYGRQYPNINYIVKLNSRTNLIKPKHNDHVHIDHSDPISRELWSVQDVAALKQASGLHIRGIGYTVYLGSEFEDEMLTEAAQAVHQAHKEGLVAILWIYPRGIHIQNETDSELLAGAAGVANALGADAVKIRSPEMDDINVTEQLKIIKKAAGNTLVIAAGGHQIAEDKLLTVIAKQINNGNLDGVAIGRNIFQHSLANAIALTKAIAAIVYVNAT